MTKYWVVDPSSERIHPFILEAGRLIAAGEIVAFPTETVYGLGADARSTPAVEAVFRAKGRPSDNPLIVHIADEAQLDGLVADVGPIARRLMARFWPGPLTLVLPVRPGAVSPRVTAGLPTVAVRMPAHPVALALIRASGCPVAAPSANRSGRPSPTLAAHVRDDLDGRIAGILDGGPAGVGLESTVVEVVGDRVHILRPGGVTPRQLLEAAPEAAVDGVASDGRRSADEARASAAEREMRDASYTPKSPGMKYTHYAPEGELTVVQGQSPETVAAWIQARINEARQRGERTGVLAWTDHAKRYDADLVVPCGGPDDLDAAAHGLYAALRQFDERGVTYILAEAYPEEGLGLALMNRLRKAAGGRVVQL